MTHDPLVEHFRHTLRAIETMAVSAAMASVPKLPFGVKLGEPKSWDAETLHTVAVALAEGARMAAAEHHIGRAA